MEGSGSIEIVWPDGSIETRSLPGSFGRSFEVGTNQIIKLKGDLDKITSFRAFGYSTGISKILGLQHLSTLKHFAPGAPYYNATLDLSNNQNLESLDLWFFTLPEWFILPPKHNINGLTIELADRSITKEEIDILINNIYANSVDRNIRGGRIHLTNSDTPSQEALKKIQILIDNYGWEINLNL